MRVPPWGNDTSGFPSSAESAYLTQIFESATRYTGLALGFFGTREIGRSGDQYPEDESARDFCHHRRIKCERVSSDARRCKNCDDFDIACVSDRPYRRGHVSDDARRQHNVVEETTAHTETTFCNDESQHGGEELSRDSHRVSPTSGANTQGLSSAWQAVAWNTVPTVTRLLRIYHETVYPMCVRTD
ncbi:hypothetical protein ANO11243_091830 [Dothideomycetidae sp. 11243]|nr:hypothetical protein ANO11243_091830 [fungal sp. No.11243]